MKRMALVLAFAALASIVGSVFAADYSCGFKAADRYLAGNGAIFHTDPVAQGFCGIAYKGWYAEVWQSASQSHGFGDELDGTIQYSHDRGNSGFGMDAGVLYIAINSDAMNNVVQPFLYFRQKLGQGPTVNLKFKYAVATQDNNPSRGRFIAGSIVHRWNKGRWSFGGEVEFTRDMDGAFGFSRANILQVEPTVGFQVNKSIRFDLLRYRWSKTYRNSDTRGTEGVFGTGLSAQF